MEGGTMEEGVLALYKALGIVFLIAMIPVFAVWAASFKTAFPVSGGALLIVIALILQGVNLLEYRECHIESKMEQSTTERSLAFFFYNHI